MIVRHLIPSDVDEILRLSEQWLNPLWERARKKILLNVKIYQDENNYVIVADRGDKLIGFVDCVEWVDWLTLKKRLLIQHVYVDNDHRKQGVGTEMLNFIINKVKPDFVFVDTKPDKFPHAEGLYRKVGFKENPKRKWLERYGN